MNLSVYRRAGWSIFWVLLLIASPTSLAVAQQGAQVAAAHASSGFAHDEAINFESHGAILSGTLIWPEGRPKAAIVLVHGSGPQARSTQPGRMIASRGFAVLTYDKRGVGRSEGVYEGGRNTSAANLHLLADDAGAAVRQLARRSELRGRPIGLLGASQAGWILPLVAVKDREIAFIGLWAGPVCKVSEQFRFQKLTGAGADIPQSRREQIIARLTAGGDIDPYPSLSRLHIPAMWVFGGKDEQVPTDLSAQRLDRLIKSGHREIGYRIFPDLGRPALSRESADYMLDWLDNLPKVGG
jgi:pimeloyl-ACP methyl ester carboxylesterase